MGVRASPGTTTSSRAALSREWHSRVTELAVAAREIVRKVRAKAPERTYMFGISNGGYLTRWQLENRPELYDGGLDWEGTLFRVRGPEPVMTYLPTALKHYPAYAATGDQAAHDAMIEAGFEPGSEFLWPFHHAVYWDLTQRIYRESFDPTWDGDLNAGIPYCASGTPNCDADYDYASRPDEVKAAVALGREHRTHRQAAHHVQGTLDTLLPISTSGDPYDALIDSVGHGDLHRYYRIADGTHTDAPLRPLPGAAPSDAAVRPHRVRRARRLGRDRRRAAGGPHRPATVGRSAGHLFPLTRPPT